MTKKLDHKPTCTEPQRGTPPMVGWWLTRTVRATGQTNGFSFRRWWNGTDWSFPVGPQMSDAEAEKFRDVLALHRQDSIEWCGLTFPASEYPYLLHAQSTAVAIPSCEMQAEMLISQNQILQRAFYEQPEDEDDIDHSARGIGTGIVDTPVPRRVRPVFIVDSSDGAAT